MANVGTLNNSGIVYVGKGATLNLTNQAGGMVGTGTAGNTGYYQLANGTLGEFIEMSSFGVIAVNGGVHLDGTLEVMLASGFNPAVGATYEFLTFTPGSYDGTEFASILNDIFNNRTEMWAVIYDNADGDVELLAEANTHPTPEPSGLLLLGSGLMVGVGILRRKLMP